jgi:hypothetical protein
VLREFIRVNIGALLSASQYKTNSSYKYVFFSYINHFSQSHFGS